MRKPSPKIFRRALRLMQISASETVYVGDELDHDVEGAKKVGLHTILLKRPLTNMAASNAKPDIIICSWKELPNALKALEKLRNAYANAHCSLRPKGQLPSTASTRKPINSLSIPDRLGIYPSLLCFNVPWVLYPNMNRRTRISAYPSLKSTMGFVPPAF
jgi:hypothetical protein